MAALAFRRERCLNSFMDATKPLTLKLKSPSEQRKFLVLLEYLQNGFCKTKAYQKHYPNSSYNAARANACILFKELGVKEELQAQLERKGLTKQEDLLLKLNKIIDGEETRDADKIAAIKLAAQLQGMLTEKREITERHSRPEISKAELEHLQSKADKLLFSRELTEQHKKIEQLEREKVAMEKLLSPIES